MAALDLRIFLTVHGLSRSRKKQGKANEKCYGSNEQERGMNKDKISLILLLEFLQKPHYF
jgi:hypothetical protein